MLCLSFRVSGFGGPGASGLGVFFSCCLVEVPLIHGRSLECPISLTCRSLDAGPWCRSLGKEFTVGGFFVS